MSVSESVTPSSPPTAIQPSHIHEALRRYTTFSIGPLAPLKVHSASIHPPIISFIHLLFHPFKFHSSINSLFFLSSIHLFFYLFIHSSIHPSIHPSIHLVISSFHFQTYFSKPSLMTRTFCT